MKSPSVNPDRSRCIKKLGNRFLCSLLTAMPQALPWRCYVFLNMLKRDARSKIHACRWARTYIAAGTCIQILTAFKRLAWTGDLKVKTDLWVGQARADSWHQTRVSRSLRTRDDGESYLPGGRLQRTTGAVRWCCPQTPLDHCALAKMLVMEKMWEPPGRGTSHSRSRKLY